MSGWVFEQATGDAGAFHRREIPDPARRSLWQFEVERPALVIGSAQPLESVDAAAVAAAGVDVVRRRSGGGAVLLDPGRSLWLDVVLPRGDPLWDDDVGVAAHWLGDAWAVALRSLGVMARVHRGGMVHTPWSSLVCFAGLGPGEVVDEAGRKLVGLSQRRTRAGARFQCVALAGWEPEALVGLLVLPATDRAAAVAEIAPAAAPVGVGLDALARAVGRALAEH